MVFGVNAVPMVGEPEAALQPELTERALPSPSSTWIEAALNACGMAANAVAGVLPNSTVPAVPLVPAVLNPVLMVPSVAAFGVTFDPGVYR